MTYLGIKWFLVRKSTRVSTSMTLYHIASWLPGRKMYLTLSRDQLEAIAKDKGYPCR